MALAEKISRAKADYDAVYAAGKASGGGGSYDEDYAKGEAEGYNKGVAEVEAQNAEILTDCNTQLESKGVESAERLEQVPQRIGEIKEEPMWVSYMCGCDNLFYGSVFPENTELTFNIPSICGSVAQMFQNTVNLVRIKLTGQAAPDKTTFSTSGWFRYNYDVKIVDLSECYFPFGNWYMAFSGCFKLEEIIGVLSDNRVYANNFTNAFGSCAKLREVRFADGAIFKAISFSNCPLLSDNSIQSIIGGLDDLTGATTQTLSLHKDVGNKLTQAQKDAITAKNWTLAY